MNALVKRDEIFPSTLRDDLFRPFEFVFDDFFTNFFKGTTALDRVRAYSGYPKMDISEVNGELVLRAAVPGVSFEDVRVEMLNDQILEISGKTSQEYHHEDGDVKHLRELSHSSFTRRVTLSKGLGDPYSAKLKDGILTLKWKLPHKVELERKLIEVVQE